MSIFDFFKNKEQIAKLTESRDERKAECPYCHLQLTKVPGAKTKCPHCGESMFVRTGTDNVRLVATKDEADKIDEEWRVANGTQDVFLAEKKKFEDRKALLKKKFGGKEPSDNDVYWGIYNEQIIEYASNGQWSLYRNVRFQMAEILRKENKLKAALQFYLGVCYLDLNGSQNMPVDENGHIVSIPEYFKPFDPELKFLAPGIIRIIKKIIMTLKIGEQEVREMYFDYASKEQRSTSAPSSPSDTADELMIEIFDPLTSVL